MNFYNAIKESITINEEKSFVSDGIAAMAKAVNDGRIIGFLTARAGMENHNKLIRQMIIMTALKMSNKREDFKGNFFKAKKQFDKKLFFFINDMNDTLKKIKGQIDKKVFFSSDGKEPHLLDFKDEDMRLMLSKLKNDEKKAYILTLLSKVYEGKIKFFDDEEKNIVTAKKLEEINNKIKTYDIKNFKEHKLITKKTSDKSVFMFDIDGTLIDAEATVWIIKNDGTKQGISQEDFATGKYKLDMGDKLDFKEFSDRDHLTKLAKEFNEIIRTKMLEKFTNMQLNISKTKLEDDTFSGAVNGKKISVRKMPDNTYLMDYDGTVSKSSSFLKLLKNLKNYFLNVTTESISQFDEARLLKLGLKRIDKKNNDIYRFKNYSVYLNRFDEDNNFAFIKEEVAYDDYFYLLTERQMNNYELKNIEEVLSYIEENKKSINKWESLKDMVLWLRDNRQLPINESYFRDIMIIED
jgi:hypothetical protein